jgi:hypothetical protein
LLIIKEIFTQDFILSSIQRGLLGKNSIKEVAQNRLFFIVLGGLIREIHGTIPTPLAIKRDIGDWGKEATVQLEFGFKEDTGENLSGYFSVSRNSGSLIWHNNKTGVDTTLA